jgi:hypothetical protein
VTACAWCPNEAVLTPYFDSSLPLCGGCAQGLVRRLDDEDLWPPVYVEEITTVPGDGPLRYDGAELRRLGAILAEFGSRMHVDMLDGGPVLSCTEAVPLDVAVIASSHYWLLVYAWASRPSGILKACDYCSSPFLLPRSNTSKCPVCGKGKRTEVINISFTDPPVRSRRKKSA